MLCSQSFDLLPAEMIKHIESFLSANSASALALCNHGLSGALGERRWNLLRSDRDERAVFLQCLERDLPEHLLRPLREAPFTLWTWSGYTTASVQRYRSN